MDAASPLLLRCRPLQAGLILLLAALLAGRHIQEPFGAGFRGVNGAAYYGQFERHYLRYGLAGCRFSLVLQSYPGTKQGMIRDLNHPPLPSWIFHAAVLFVGKLEAGLKLTALVATILGLLAFYLVARHFLEEPGAMVALLLAASSPMVLFWGPMVVAEGFEFVVLSLTLLAVTRYSEGRSGLYLPLLAVFGACLFDWWAFWTVPASLLLAFRLRRRHPFPRRLYWLVAAAGLAFLCNMLLATYAAGSFGALKAEVLGASRTARGGSLPVLLWLIKEGHDLVAGFGVPLLLLAGAGGLRLLARLGRGPRPSIAGPASFFLVVGLCHTLAFRRHAQEHPFWMEGMGGGLFLLGALGILTLFRMRGPWRPLSVLLLLLALIWGVSTTWKQQDSSATRRFLQTGAWVNAHSHPGDLIITSAPWLQEIFYIKGRAFSHIRNLAQLQTILTRYQELHLKAPIKLMLPHKDLLKPGIQAIMRYVAPYCRPPREAGNFRIYSFRPA